MMGSLAEPVRLFDLTLRTGTIRPASREGLAEAAGFAGPERVESLVTGKRTPSC
jgi:hypothetical protein